MKTLCWLLVVSGQVFLALSVERKPLNKFIHHYEPLNYAESDIKEAFKNGLETKSFDFKAHGRDFKLRLEPDRDTFHPGIDGLSDEIKDHLNSALAGYLEDEPDSEAFGSIRDGKFEGTIFANDGEYTVRPAEMFFEKPQEFHSVIYRSSDEDEGQRRKRSLFSDEMTRSNRRRRETNEFDEPDSFNLYKQKDNKNLRVCNISIEADYLFTEAWGNDTGRAIGEMVYLVRIANQKFVEMAKSRYWKRKTGEKLFTVRLMIGHIFAYTYETTPEELKPKSMGVSTFLDFVSDRDYDSYCQAFFLTYRDFEGGITGLSWGGDRGGICQPRRYFIKIYENFSVQKRKSYNTGVITYKFFGSLVPPKIGEIAFLRQVGTAFGAPDDPDTKECQPGIYNGGNYIMYDKASNGGRANNYKFSPCSIKAIAAVLDSTRINRALIKDRSDNAQLLCFETPKKIIEWRPKCGDTIIQNHEQCDCGTPEECKVSDPGNCCNPKTCRLRKGAYCSANDGPCCDPKTCSHRSADYTCRPGDECAFAARCRNLRGFENYQCPGRVKKGNYKPCATESQVCLDGICSNSVCRRYGLTECQCSDTKYQCYVCCNFLNRCEPALHIPRVTGFRKPTLPIGAPCLNDSGFCDIFHVCKVVDLKTPIDNIEELYYKREDVKTITLKYWWVFLIGSVVLIAFIAILIFCVNKRTPSSIPKPNRNVEMSLLQSNGSGK